MIGAIIGGLGAGLKFLSAGQDRAAQKQFAKNGIQWRAEDARKAGIHPLAALGASTASYTPVGDGGAGDTLANAGSSLENAINERKKAPLAAQAVQAEIDTNRAQAELLRAQRLQVLNQVKQTSMGAVAPKRALPTPDQAKDMYIKVRGADGKISYMQNPDLSQDFGEMIATQLQHQFGRAMAYAGPVARKRFGNWYKRGPLEVTVTRKHARGN